MPWRHEWAQAPQFSGSEPRSTQAVPHWVIGQVDPDEEEEEEEDAVELDDAPPAPEPPDPEPELLLVDIPVLADEEEEVEPPNSRIVGVHDAAQATQPAEINSVCSA